MERWQLVNLIKDKWLQAHLYAYILMLKMNINAHFQRVVGLTEERWRGKPNVDGVDIVLSGV